MKYIVEPPVLKNFKAYFFASLTHSYAITLIFMLDISDCSSTAIGVADNSTIPNDRFTASTTYNSWKFKPWYARLNGNLGWTPSSKNDVQAEWLQIDFGSSYFICAIATQGSGLHNEYVKKYKLQLSSNNKDWTYYMEGGVDRASI